MLLNVEFYMPSASEESSLGEEVQRPVDGRRDELLRGEVLEEGPLRPDPAHPGLLGRQPGGLASLVRPGALAASFAALLHPLPGVDAGVADLGLGLGGAILGQ